MNVKPLPHSTMVLASTWEADDARVMVHGSPMGGEGAGPRPSGPMGAGGGVLGATGATEPGGLLGTLRVEAGGDCAITLEATTAPKTSGKVATRRGMAPMDRLRDALDKWAILRGTTRPDG